MADVFSKEKRSEIMSKIHQPTKLEMRVHEWLLSQSIDHEMYPKVEGKPDIRIGSLYVFVDGCFWHCCPEHYRRPKSRRNYWIPHIEESNARREKRRKNLPYSWTRIWEHDVKTGKFRETIHTALGAK